jgi:hypothetical protein
MRAKTLGIFLHALTLDALSVYVFSNLRLFGFDLGILQLCLQVLHFLR